MFLISTIAVSALVPFWPGGQLSKLLPGKETEGLFFGATLTESDCMVWRSTCTVYFILIYDPLVFK